MKVLNVSRLSFILALLLGLVTAWCVATPHAVLGESSTGSAGCCNGTYSADCGPHDEGDTCSNKYTKCNTSGTRDCEPSSPSTCRILANCANKMHENCM